MSTQVFQTEFPLEACLGLPLDSLQGRIKKRWASVCACVCNLQGHFHVNTKQHFLFLPEIFLLNHISVYVPVIYNLATLLWFLTSVIPSYIQNRSPDKSHIPPECGVEQWSCCFIYKPITWCKFIFFFFSYSRYASSWLLKMSVVSQGALEVRITAMAVGSSFAFRRYRVQTFVSEKTVPAQVSFPWWFLAYPYRFVISPNYSKLQSNTASLQNPRN